MGAIGLMGAMACLLVLITLAPPPSAIAGYALILDAMAKIAGWVFFPSLGATLIAGLLAIGVNPAFHSAGWAWAKAASGILVFEGGFLYVVGPIQDEAKRSATVLHGHLSGVHLSGSLDAERGTLWLLLAVSTANVVLGVWRPRFTRLGR
jgi:hypothetical protein